MEIEMWKKITIQNCILQISYFFSNLFQVFGHTGLYADDNLLLKGRFVGLTWLLLYCYHYKGLNITLSL